MENELTNINNINRELEYNYLDKEKKLVYTLEEKICIENDYERYISDKNDTIDRLTYEIEEIRREVEKKEEIIKNSKITKDKEIKTSMFVNQEDDFSDNNITLTPNVKIKNSPIRNISKSLLNLDNDEVNENKSKEEYTKYSNKNYIEDLNNLNINAISAKIDDALNNSFKDSPFTMFDKSSINDKINTPNIKEMIINGNNSNEDNDEKEFIRQIIDQEVKNILENRKTFILNTLTQENFSFDLINSKMVTIDENNNNSNKKKSNNKTKIIENIDEILSKIQARKEKVLNQKKFMINKLEKMGIKIF